MKSSFGQEQIPISAIAAAPGGSSGQAQTLAGQSVSTLLGAANPCAKVNLIISVQSTLLSPYQLQQADLILSELGSRRT
jgi:hypothetical protein